MEKDGEEELIRGVAVEEGAEATGSRDPGGATPLYRRICHLERLRAASATAGWKQGAAAAGGGAARGAEEADARAQVELQQGPPHQGRWEGSPDPDARAVRCVDLPSRVGAQPVRRRDRAVATAEGRAGHRRRHRHRHHPVHAFAVHYIPSAPHIAASVIDPGSCDLHCIPVRAIVLLPGEVLCASPSFVFLSFCFYFSLFSSFVPHLHGYRSSSG